jgi:hypothetical protein
MRKNLATCHPDLSACHSRKGGNPAHDASASSISSDSIPAFAGMTTTTDGS